MLRSKRKGERLIRKPNQVGSLFGWSFETARVYFLPMFVLPPQGVRFLGAVGLGLGRLGRRGHLGHV